MIQIIFKLILSSLLLFSIFACAKNKKNLKTISVYQESATLQADDKIANIPVTLPKAHSNHSWFGQNSDNTQIENFAFPAKITKSNSIWSGYSGGDIPMVFAPVIVENNIYLLDAQGNLSARNLDNKKLLWKKKITKKSDDVNFTAGKISYREGIIFATSGYDLVVAIDLSGNEIWSKKIGAITISAPIADQNQVYVITNDNKTYALNIKTGEINWIHSAIVRNTGILGAANPVSDKNLLISAYSSGEIYALNKKDGEILWLHDLNLNKAVNSDFILNDVDATPIIKDGVIYSIGNGGLMMAIDIKGNILWQKELATITDFWIADNFIYLVNNDNQLICLFKKTGQIRWIKNLKKYIKDKNPASKIIYNGLVMAGGNLILSNSNREILLISPLNGEILQTKKTGQKIYHTPIIAGEKLYIQTVGSLTANLIIMK